MYVCTCLHNYVFVYIRIFFSEYLQHTSKPHYEILAQYVLPYTHM